MPDPRELELTPQASHSALKPGMRQDESHACKWLAAAHNQRDWPACRDQQVEEKRAREAAARQAERATDAAIERERLAALQVLQVHASQFGCYRPLHVQPHGCNRSSAHPLGRTVQMCINCL